MPMPQPNEIVPREQQEPLYRALADELIALTPEWWNAAVLTVAVEVSSGGVLSMPHEISSPDGHGEPIAVSDETTDLTYKLLTLFQEHGKGWTGLQFGVRRLPNGNWHYTCDLSYE